MLKRVIIAVLLSCVLIIPLTQSNQLNTTAWVSLHPDEPIYGITMKPGEEKALVNGVTTKLRGVPFVENDVFYYPLEDVVELHGDFFQLKEDLVTVDAGDLGTYTFAIDSTNVKAQDGTVWDNSLQQFYFSNTQPTYCKETIRTPILREGVVYVPYGFLLSQWDGPQYLKLVSQYADSGFVIFQGKENQNGFLGYEILTEFDALPAEKRESLVCLGPKGEVRDNYDEVEYRGEGYSVFVLRLKKGARDSDRLNGLISAIIVDDSKLMTDRGLRVGDSAERAWELYGYDLMRQFGYEIEDGKISRFGFRSPYYSTCGIMSIFVEEVW